MKNNYLIIGGIVLVLIVASVIGFTHFKGNSNQKDSANEEVLPQTEAIPTVDSSVQVSLEGVKDNKEVILSIKNAPNATDSIEYELSYLSKGTLPKGVIGTLDMAGKSTAERQITLGTCSSGTCVYDTGVTSVKVSLKFNGPYGAKAYEKEFPL